MKLALLLLLLALVACGGSRDAPPAAPTDQTLARHEQAGQIAFALDRPAEAVEQFAAALRQAEARDDLAAIGEISFNLAVAQLRANRPQDALATAQRARAELTRRGRTPFAALDLAEATALYRSGAQPQADALAATIETGADADAAAGASFLRGLIADEAGNQAGLQNALTRLSTATTPVRKADRLELQARLAIQQDNPGGATSAAQTAAAIRQDILDYRGMARALAVAALANEKAGQQEAAADLYLRAGRSAAAQSDVDTARPWLQQVLTLTRDSATKAAATETLETLGTAPE